MSSQQNLDHLQELCNHRETLKLYNQKTTDNVGLIRDLIREIEQLITGALDDNNAIPISENDLSRYRKAINRIVSCKNLSFVRKVETSTTVKNFQLGGSNDDIWLPYKENSLVPPEKGTIKLKLWKVGLKNNANGFITFSDTSDESFAGLITSQLSTALNDAPPGAVETLDLVVKESELRNLVERGSRDLTGIFTQFEQPGLTARQVRDVDVLTDPALQFLTSQQRNSLKQLVDQVNNNNATLEQLSNRLTELGVYSLALGPHPNHNYSDLKRFQFERENGEIVTVTASIPVISWGESDVSGFPLRKHSDGHVKSNRRDSGTSYIVDLGGHDIVIRQGHPNPLPPHRYFNNGPSWTKPTEGAIDRYMGGKCLGMNTTSSPVTFSIVLQEQVGPIELVVPAFTAIWKLDRATFNFGNEHAYYTVFSSSRPPPAGMMGVVWAPKQNRLGRGRGEIASGVTLANGVSKTGKTFNLQDDNGPILDDNGHEQPSGLKGLTCDYDGHGMAARDLLDYMQKNGFQKGTQYLSIPSNATLETVEDILIPAGQFVPQITASLATLLQFANGKYIQDGGPGRFQSGLIPFLPGTPAYTPEWHINFIHFNIGRVYCDGEIFDVENIAKEQTPEAWIRAEHNASFGPPGPSPDNSRESGFSPAFPDTFHPVQLKCETKGAFGSDYIDRIEGTEDTEISLAMIPTLEQNNHIFITEAPPGALRGWVKFLVVNCPLPVTFSINILNETTEEVNADDSISGGTGCTICNCDREAMTVDINGDLQPLWMDNSQNELTNDSIKFKVGDNIVIRSTSATLHGVALRLNGLTSGVNGASANTLQTVQDAVLTEIEKFLTVNNKDDLENNVIALSQDVLDFQGGVPITFKQQASVNPVATPDGVSIASLTIKDGASGQTGTVVCTVHGVSMSFKFEIC